MGLFITKIVDALKISDNGKVDYYNPKLIRITANVNDEFSIIHIDNNKPLGRYHFSKLSNKMGAKSLEEYLDFLYSSHTISMQKPNDDRDQIVQFSLKEFYTKRKHINGKYIYGKTFISNGVGPNIIPDDGLIFNISDIIPTIDEIINYEGKFLAWIDEIQSTHPVDIIMSWETYMPINMQVIVGQYRPDLGTLEFKKANSPIIDNGGVSNFYFMLYYTRNI